ncbi:TonB-dependent siderophore receptor [Rapidithrix thailandica]|uniref:TonB-dependent siderophore receptor n=1 Tax=Rapidithrix thailandica TaxID=413964 RepID=A0AAW9RTB6_9BACT
MNNTFHAAVFRAAAKVILLVTLCLTTHVIFAQNTILDKEISITFKNDNLTSALKKLEEKASCNFSFESMASEENRTVTKSYTKTSLREILNEILVQYQIYYRIRGNTIFIQKNAKKGRLTGTILDKEGNLIPFSSIILKGTHFGASSDKDGNYSFYAPEGNYFVVASSIGFKSVSKTVAIDTDKTTTLNFVLNESTENLDEVVVTGTREQGYIVPYTNALLTPIKTVEAPASISILSDNFLEDIGARNISTVVTYVPGVSNADNGGGQVENVIIRGFPQSENYINGIRQYRTPEGIRAIETIERVQILKGPAGVEASVTSPGGFMNIITKKPKDTFAAEVFLGGGNHNFLRAGGDVTGSLVKDKLKGRIIAGYQQRQFWRDGQGKRPYVTIAPSVDWKIINNTNLIVEYEYNWANDPLDRGTIYLEGAGLKDNFLPRTFTFHGDDDDYKIKSNRLDLSLNHKLSDKITVSLKYHNFSQKTQESSFRNADAEAGYGPLFKEDGVTFSGQSVVPVFFAEVGADLKTETTQLNITGNFTNEGIGHIFYLGGSLANSKATYVDADRDFIYGIFENQIDVFHPNNNQKPTKVGENVRPNFVVGDDISSVFGQWTGQWAPKFRTVVSLRYDKIKVLSEQSIDGIGAKALAMLENQNAPNPIRLYNGSYEDELISLRLGSSYDISESLTGFIGYSSSSEPQSGVTRKGKAIEPIRANSFEGGLKWLLFNDKAMATTSVYFLERKNIAVSDPQNTPEERFLLPLGSAQIKGIEVELTGKLTKDLSFFGGMSVQDSEVTESDKDIVGNRFANIPLFQFSGFANYNAESIGLPGLDLGLGVVHQGEREANSGNQYQLPAYTRFDLALGYTFKNDLQIRGNLFNVFDTVYYTSAQDNILRGSDQIMVGDKRLFQITLTKKWR